MTRDELIDCIVAALGTKEPARSLAVSRMALALLPLTASDGGDADPARLLADARRALRLEVVR